MQPALRFASRLNLGQDITQLLAFVPSRILVAHFAKLRLYGFRIEKTPIPEFLKVLEKGGATAWGGAQDATHMVGIERANRGMATNRYSSAGGASGFGFLRRCAS